MSGWRTKSSEGASAPQEAHGGAVGPAEPPGQVELEDGQRRRLHQRRQVGFLGPHRLVEAGVLARRRGQLADPLGGLDGRAPGLLVEGDPFDGHARAGGELLDGFDVRRPEPTAVRRRGAADGTHGQPLDPDGGGERGDQSQGAEQAEMVGVLRMRRRYRGVPYELGLPGGHDPADGRRPPRMVGPERGQPRQRRGVGVGGGDPPDLAVVDDVDGTPVGEARDDGLGQGAQRGGLVVETGHERPAALGQQRQVTAGMFGFEAGAARRVLQFFGAGGRCGPFRDQPRRVQWRPAEGDDGPPHPGGDVGTRRVPCALARAGWRHLASVGPWGRVVFPGTRTVVSRPVTMGGYDAPGLWRHGEAPAHAPGMNSQTPEAGTVGVPDLDWNAVRGVAYASCRNLPMWVPRDDLLQEASLAAWQAAGRWRPDGGSSLGGFVARRAVGAVRDVMRKNAASTRDGNLRPVLVPLDEHRDPPAAVGDTDVDLRVTFDQALDRLPPRHRHVVVEHFLNDRTIMDVGRDLGVSGAAVSLIGKSALNRLRKDADLRDWIGLAS